MSRIVLAAAAFAISLAAVPASAQDGRMTVAAFLDTAEDIPRNPTAMLRADTRRLLSEVRTATRTVRAEQDTAHAPACPTGSAWTQTACWPASTPSPLPAATLP